MTQGKVLNPVNFVRNAMRNSPWVVIAVALHLVVLAGAAIFVTTRPEQRQAEGSIIVTTTEPRIAEEPIDAPEQFDRRAIPKNEEAELVSHAVDVYIPQLTDLPEDLSKERGDPNALDNTPAGGTPAGTAIGVGRGGHAGGSKPSPFPDRARGLGQGGGRGDPLPPKETERAVLEGLRWLLRHQNDDGSWGADRLSAHCPADDPCFDAKAGFSSHYNEGLTGLALLAFLGAGLGHDSKIDIVDTTMRKRHKVGTAVKKGLQWLVDRQNQDGSFSRDKAFMYNEALAGMALAEAYGLSQNRYWKEPAQRAMNFLMDAQRPSPTGQGLWGWRYASRADIERGLLGTGDESTKKDLYDSDTSVTAWCIMALKSGHLSGLEVRKEHMDGGVAFAKWATADNGLVGYNDPKSAGLTVQGTNDHFTYHPAVMSALGMCVRIFVEHDVSDPFLDLAAQQVVKDLPAVSKDWLSIDYYYWYYASLALNQIDGPDAPRRTGRYWGPWKKAMEASLIGLQDKSERTHKTGGWITGDRWAYTGGPLYSTALNVLTLEVYYRYENAFGGGKRN